MKYFEYLEICFNNKGLFFYYVEIFNSSEFILTPKLFLSRPHMTRLFKTIPLRESFSLPFIFIQMTLLTIFFQKNVRASLEVKCL